MEVIECVESSLHRNEHLLVLRTSFNREPNDQVVVMFPADETAYLHKYVFEKLKEKKFWWYTVGMTCEHVPGTYPKNMKYPQITHFRGDTKKDFRFYLEVSLTKEMPKKTQQKKPPNKHRWE